MKSKLTCILTETTKINKKKIVWLKKIPIIISPYSIFDIDKLAHAYFCKILNINDLLKIICPSTAKNTFNHIFPIIKKS